MVSIIEITPMVPLVLESRFASLMAGIIRQDAILRKVGTTGWSQSGRRSVENRKSIRGLRREAKPGPTLKLQLRSRPRSLAIGENDSIRSLRTRNCCVPRASSPVGGNVASDETVSNPSHVHPSVEVPSPLRNSPVWGKWQSDPARILPLGILVAAPRTTHVRGGSVP
jgi:hypothetical protein